MKYVNYTLRFLAVCCLIILLDGCKSSKNLIVTDGSAVAKTQEQLVEDMLGSQVDFKTISGKISLEMIPGNRTSGTKVNSQLKIIKDEVIQLSLRAPFINTEVFRMNITPDKVYVIDRMSKQIVIEDISELEKKGIMFNFNNLQSLFTNALFYPGKKQVTPKDADKFDIRLVSGKYFLNAKDKSGLNYVFTVDGADRITETNISGGNTGKYALDWLYDEFIQDGKYIYPTKMTAKANIQDKRLSVVMSYSGLDINTDITVDQNLPSNYQRVTLGEILKNYIK